LRVKRRLQINLGVSAITAFIIAGILLLGLYRVNRAFQGLDIADEILSILYERSALRSDYVQNGTARAKLQWFIGHDQTGKLLKTASERFGDAEDKIIIDELLEDHEMTIKLFTGIIENREKAGSGSISAELYRKIENRLLTKLNIRLYEKVLNIAKLRESARGRLVAELKQTGWGIALLITIAAAMAVISSLNTGRAITSSIGRLREGALVIGEGNLDYRIGIKGDDEFVELAGAFNAMTEKLRGSYLELENEIAGRKRSEEELRRSSETLEAFFAVSPGILNIFDEQLRYIESDRLTPTYFGLDRRSIIGKSAGELNPPFVETFLGPMKQRIIETGEPELNVEVPGPVPSRQNETGYWQVSYFPIPLPEGRRGLGVMGIDITDVKRAEEALRQSEERFRSFFHMTAVGAAQVDPATGRFVLVNDRFCRITGYNREELLTMSFRDITHPDDRKKDSEEFARLSMGEIPVYDVEKRYVRKDGRTVWVHLSVTLIRDAEGRPHLTTGVVQDITDRKRDQEERELLIGRLESVIRELEGFTFSVSHDLRAPIRHITSYTELLRKASWPDLNEKSREYLATVMKASGRLGVLIEELLEFSRMGRTPMQKTDVDLGLLVRETIRNLENDAESREIEWKIGDLPEISGDPSMLQFVLSNLIGNAMKFTRPRTSAVIEISSTETDDEYVIHLKDNGVGFNMQYYDKLFRVFHRLHSDEEFEGAGIGLANVERIIQRHGGRVWAEGKEDEGAEFWFSLPKKGQE
jgi:PAS domain S-box-containing protein